MMSTAIATAERYYPPRAAEVAHAWLRSPIYRELQSEACRRGIHVDVLTAQIVAGAVVLGMVDDIIDGADKLLFR
jgi:hypothetical protein